MSRAAHANVEVGIHVRNAPWGNRVKKNTSKPPKDKPGKRLRKARANLERRRIAHDATIKSLPAATPASAFRKPGSMKGH